MTEPRVPGQDASVARTLAVVVVAAAVLRILAAVVAGFIEIAQSGSEIFPSGARFRAADVLAMFGAAGDGVGVLLGLAALGLLWVAVARGVPAGERLTGALRAVFAATALLAVLSALGAGLGLGGVASQAGRLVVSVVFPLAYAAVAVAAFVLVPRIEPLAEPAYGEDDDAYVFAVDRDSGDVHAFFSFDDAARRTHVYSVEDNEFAFYTDTGQVVLASVENARVVLRPSAVDAREELLDRLQRFATRRGLHVDVLDVDEPAAYAVPISDWQWLQMWPAWLRWLGRVFRPR